MYNGIRETITQEDFQKACREVLQVHVRFSNNEETCKAAEAINARYPGAEAFVNENNADIVSRGLKKRLEHMLQAIERICRYTKGKNFEDFIADDMMYYAVVKNIEILGEASNMLTEEFRQAHPKTPWKQVNGMRNYIVHEYFQVDNNVVWDVITNDLPILEQQIKEYLTEEK